MCTHIHTETPHLHMNMHTSTRGNTCSHTNGAGQGIPVPFGGEKVHGSIKLRKTQNPAAQPFPVSGLKCLF